MCIKRVIFDLTVWIVGAVAAATLIAEATAAEGRAIASHPATWNTACGGCERAVDLPR